MYIIVRNIVIMLSIKKPDLNAPRYYPSMHVIAGRSFFNKFRKKFPQYKEYSDTKLKKVIDTYNKKLWESAIENRDGIELPEGLGHVFIGTCPSPRGFNTDMRNSINTGTRLRHRNFESDNYLAKIFYTSFASKYRFMHRRLWVFDGCRKFTRTVSATYPDNWKKYIQVDNFRYISKLYKKKVMANKYAAVRTDNSATDDYNEFDMN